MEQSNRDKANLQKAAAYMESGAMACLYCQSKSIESKNVPLTIGPGVTNDQVYACNDCGRRWTARYQLTAVIDDADDHKLARFVPCTRIILEIKDGAFHGFASDVVPDSFDISILELDELDRLDAMLDEALSPSERENRDELRRLRDECDTFKAASKAP